MGVIVSAPTAALVDAPCPECFGEGGFDGDHTEPGSVCEACAGSGVREVCSDCRRVPTVSHGVEVCGCTLATFPLVLGRVA